MALSKTMMDMPVGNENEQNSEYIWYFKVVEGVKCIQWKEGPQNDKERVHIKKIKERVGKTHKEILMIDTKPATKGNREFCDVIFTTDDCERWDKLFSEFYKEKHLTKVSNYINGGYQNAWINGGSTFITMNFYTNKGRVMVQPGQQDEQNIIQFIQDFGEVKEITLPKQIAKESKV